VPGVLEGAGLEVAAFEQSVMRREREENIAGLFVLAKWR
jgi:hypothetical protein